MRVLMLSWEYPPHVVGGLGKHVLELTPPLVAEGAEIHVLTPLLRSGAARETTPDGVVVSRVEPPRMEDYGFVTFATQVNDALIGAARKLQLNSQRFDLIHAHDWLTARAGITLKHAWRIPLIATIHATERGRWQGSVWNGQTEQINGIEWQLCYESWRVITCSQFMGQQVQEYFGVPDDKVDVIPNGVRITPSPFRSEAERLAWRRRFADDGRPIVFYVGRVVYEKGLHVLLAAWPEVLAEYPGARLLIAGTGNYLDALKASAWALGLTRDVIFTGFIPDEDRDRLYHIADVAVFPSLYEPFGIVALEAMAARCPVVVAETGGLKEVVRLHETGLTVHPNDPQSLAWGILHTLRHPEWSRARTENGYREAAEVYCWEHVASATHAVYRRTQGEWQQSSWGKEITLHNT
ncbi:MAG TPA: glycosyltransferase family 4 protein [Roseiflexaceae bacterium]|nr:glycosyltransferase family 4 protein [Roseiflexaceae bacterium]